MTDEAQSSPPCCPVGARDDAGEVATGVVYFIQHGRAGPIKIGKTFKPVTHRLAQLQVGNPFRLYLLATVPGYSRTESRMHRRFAALRIRSTEWFEPGEALRNYVNDRQAGLPDDVEREHVRAIAECSAAMDDAMRAIQDAAAVRIATLTDSATRFLARPSCPG